MDPGHVQGDLRDVLLRIRILQRPRQHHLRGGLVLHPVGAGDNGQTPTPAIIPSSRPGQPTRFLYEDADADGVYEPLRYADYGMWLIWDPTQATDLARIGVATRAGLVGPDAFSRSGFNLAAPATSQNGLAATATYSGTARGLSARTTTSGGDSTTASGHFTADVTLNARFGVPIADPGDGPAREGRLGGAIDNFRAAPGQDDDHVDPAWSLTLEEGGLAAGGVIRTGTVGGVTGHWRAPRPRSAGRAARRLLRRFRRGLRRRRRDRRLQRGLTTPGRPPGRPSLPLD